MPVKQPSLYIPTGYESQQRAAERKRKIAEALMAKGLGPQGPMQSWMQVLAQAASAGVGAHLDKKADKMTDEVNEQIKQDYANRLAAFQEKTNALDPASPEYDAELRGLVQGAQGDPLLADAAKPYAETMGARLKEQGEMTNFGGQMRRKGAIREGEFEPSKPNDSLWRDAQGNITPNILGINVAKAKQGMLTSEGEAMLPGQSVRMPSNQQEPQPQMPAQPAAAAGGDEASLVFQQLTPEEKQTVNGILQKYAGTNGPPAGVPYGNPTNPNMGGGPQPAGVTTDGQPYWLVNGIPYDNPEGR